MVGPGLDEPLLAVKRGSSGMANATQLWLPVVSDDRGQLLAIADSGGQLNGSLTGPQYDAGLWNSSGLTSHAQSFNPRRWSTPGGVDTISTSRSRQYDPATGKWLQEDPMGMAGGVNLYQYNNSDPNSFSDPFGLGPCKDANGNQVDCPEPNGAPPVALPKGVNGEDNSWIPVEGTGNRTKWAPKFRVPSEKGEQPGASWDKAQGHWDVDNVGKKGRRRFNADGTEVTHDGERVYGPQQAPVSGTQARRVGGAIGIGVIMYWIVSEGSRFAFPPRNLIPVP